VSVLSVQRTRRACSRLLGLALLLAGNRALADSCARPTDPGGDHDYSYGAAEVKSFGTSTVRVWYVTDGVHAVNDESSRSDAVPDDVVLVAQVTSDALASYLDLGYRAPISDSSNPECGDNGGDGRLDVYLVRMQGADGMTAIDLGRCTELGGATRCASFIFAQANFAGQYATASEGIRTVLPHELFHVLQNAYDADLDRFWAEGTAQWAAKRVDPSLTDLERYLPAFFAQTSRALDAPANGVTAAFLYGSAIWPVFLSQRHGAQIVRSILEREAEAGGSSLASADAVLADEQTSLAREFALFSAWNAATGSRAGTGGYEDAAKYPLVPLTELGSAPIHDISSGLASFFYRAQVSAPMRVTLETDSKRNTGTLVPFENGVARVDRAMPLPAELTAEGIVVVSGITSNKTDAPFTLSLTSLNDDSSAAALEQSGCALVRKPSRAGPDAVTSLLLLLISISRRRRRVGQIRGDSAAATLSQSSSSLAIAASSTLKSTGFVRWSAKPASLLARTSSSVP